MKISFVIPAHNEELCIAECLSSVLREIKRSSVPAEIIVVDNASIDRTAEIAGTFPEVKVVKEPRKGTSRARQAGFLAASGDVIANVDADIILPEGWISRVVERFEKNSDIVAISGPVVYFDLSRSMNFWVRLYELVGYLISFINRHFFGYGSLLKASNVAMRKYALEKIGGYDSRFEFYGDDADLAHRLQTAGHVEFDFKLQIYTSGRRIASEGLFTMAWRYTMNFFWPIFFKRPFTAKASVVRLELQHNGHEDPLRMKKGIKELLLGVGTVAFLGGIFVGIGTVFYVLLVALPGVAGSFSATPAEAAIIKQSSKDLLKKIQSVPALGYEAGANIRLGLMEYELRNLEKYAAVYNSEKSVKVAENYINNRIEAMQDMQEMIDAGNVADTESLKLKVSDLDKRVLRSLSALYEGVSGIERASVNFEIGRLKAETI
jgi:glycosyltransferase involved in cell wall biosynthesis